MACDQCSIKVYIKLYFRGVGKLMKVDHDFYSVVIFIIETFTNYFFSV